MAATNINRVVLTGNLTRDPELRRPPAACPSARCAWPATPAASRARSGSTSPTTSTSRSGAARARTAAQYLEKGRPVAIDGRLEWREWEDKEGKKRQSVDIVADSVQFLGSRDGEGDGNGSRFTPQSDVPADTADFQGAPAGGGGGGGNPDDDIPF